MGETPPVGFSTMRDRCERDSVQRSLGCRRSCAVFVTAIVFGPSEAERGNNARAGRQGPALCPSVLDRAPRSGPFSDDGFPGKSWFAAHGILKNWRSCAK